jgi:hypothetical protein
MSSALAHVARPADATREPGGGFLDGEQQGIARLPKPSPLW